MVLNLLFISLITALDQYTKQLTVAFVRPAGTIPLIEGALHLTYAENRGAAFSILQGQRGFFLFVTPVVLIAILVFLLKKGVHMHPLCRVSLVMVVGGAMGNYIDRIRLGYVVDMVDFRLINYAIFNLADSFVVVGTILLCYYIIFIDAKIKSPAEKGG